MGIKASIMDDREEIGNLVRICAKNKREWISETSNGMDTSGRTKGKPRTTWEMRIRKAISERNLAEEQ